jgi:large subunit ribosomal protein L24e
VYNRDLYIQTIQAMRRIEDIKHRRENVFWENRMRLSTFKKREDFNRELERHVDQTIKGQVTENINMRKEQLATRSKSKNIPKIRVDEEIMEQ